MRPMSIEQTLALDCLTIKCFDADVWGSGEKRGVIVDGDYDGEYIAGFRWKIFPESGYVYRPIDSMALRNEKTGELISGVYENSRVLYLHHLVLPLVPGFWVRHIDGNKLNNRSVNLEYRTPKDMMQFRSPPRRRKHE